MPFPTINIPLAVGQRQDLTDLAIATQDPSLAQCINAVFPAEGEIAGRPGTISLDGTTIHAVAPGLPAQAVASLGTEPDLRIGLSEFDGDPVVQCEGRMFRRRGTTWKDTGPFWSMQAHYGGLVGDPNDVLGVPASFDIDASVRPQPWWPHAGANLLAFPSTNPVANYQDNDRGWSIAAGVAVVGTIYDSRCVARDALFTTDGANLKMLRGYPQETSTTIATDGFVDMLQRNPQRLWAVKAPAGDYHVLYQTSANSVKLLRVNSAGTVLQTLTLTTGILASGSPTLSLGLATNGTKTVVSAGNGTTVLTKVVNVATWLADAVDSTHATSNTVSRVGCSVTPAGVFHTVFTVVATGDYGVLVRFTNAAGFVVTRLLYGFKAAGVYSTQSLHWSGLFPPQVLPSGRVVAGLYAKNQYLGVTSEPDPAVGGCTWLVLDVTLDLRELSVVAAGQDEESVHQGSLGSADVLDGTLYFSHLVATSRTEVSPLATRARLVKLTSVAAASIRVNGLLLHSGQYPYYLDGDLSFEASYPLAPRVDAELVGGAGAITAGSRTVTCCWAWTDAQGNIHRSAPAIPITVDNPSGYQVRVKCSLPQWAVARPAKGFNLEVYCSVANPSANADLWTNELLTVPVTTLVASSQSVTVISSPETRGTALYTGDNILENERPFGNGGVAVVGSRVWSAEGQTVYASKLVRPNEAPAWSSDDSLQLQVPSGFGEVRALGGLDNMLVIVCAEAALVFTGQGPGDAGGPSDFDSPRRVHRGRGPLKPSDLCETTSTLVWVSSLGEVFAIGPGGGVVDIGKPVQTTSLRRPVFLPGNEGTGNRVALVRDANGQRVEVIDLDVGQWSSWTFPFPYKDIGTRESYLTLLCDAYPYVAEASADSVVNDVTTLPGETVSYTMRLRTRQIPLGHLGRIKSVKPLGKLSDVDVNMLVEIQLDNDTTIPTGNSVTFAIPAATPEWPRSKLPELRAAVQRCESFAIVLETSPAAVRITGLQAEVMDSQSMPRTNRS